MSDPVGLVLGDHRVSNLKRLVEPLDLVKEVADGDQGGLSVRRGKAREEAADHKTRSALSLALVHDCQKDVVGGVVPVVVFRW